MKTLRISLFKSLIWIGICSLTAFSCSKEEDVVEPQGSGKLQTAGGIASEAMEFYAGDLGILIDTRELARKGYKPTTAIVSTTATEGDYDRELDVDPFTNLASLSLAVDDLTEAGTSELKNGVGIEIEIRDENGNVLVSQSESIVTFTHNGTEILIDGSEVPGEEIPVHFNARARHYLQLVSPSGVYSSAVVWKPSSAQDNNVQLTPRNSTFWPGTTTEQFYIEQFPGTENQFVIYSANTSRYLAKDLDNTWRQSGRYSYPTGLADRSLDPPYRFIIRRESNGLYTINDLDGNPFRRTGGGWSAGNSGTMQYFRIIAPDVQWDAEELRTEHLSPILPPAKTSFGYNSTLINCGSGDLEQEVGVQEELQTTYTASISETIGFSGRVTLKLGISATAEANIGFFGKGLGVSGTVSAGLELSVEANKSTTTFVEGSESESKKLFSRRTVTVPSGKASLVYDAYQTYSNVKVPYVKRLRMRGIDEKSGIPLSGPEIATQLQFALFDGTLLAVGSDYVEISLRGTMYLDNIVDTRTEVRDVESTCD